MGNMQIANPWSGWETLAEAEEAVGFSLGLPEKIGENYVAESYRTMSGELLEVNFFDGDYKVCVRKMKGENQDISGDYTVYAQNDTWERGGATITVFVNEEQNYVGKTLISYDGYSWSLVTPSGFAGDSAEDFFCAIVGE